MCDLYCYAIIVYLYYMSQSKNILNITLHQIQKDRCIPIFSFTNSKQKTASRQYRNVNEVQKKSIEIYTSKLSLTTLLYRTAQLLLKFSAAYIILMALLD
jgi:hypothetical protein